MSLSELDISDVDALVYFDTAPRRRKRIIAMLGLIYRCATGRSSKSRRTRNVIIQVQEDIVSQSNVKDL